jgi:hypothetical protein
MENSMYHNDRKITTEISDAKLESLPHPPYSPDLSPCDFWLFGMLKQEMKDWLFQTVEEIVTTMKTIWKGLALEKVQSVFFNWIKHFK